MKPLLLFTIFTFTVALFSCQNNANEDKYQSLNDSTSVSGLTGDSAKLIKTAGINCKVKNVEQSLKDVSALAQSQGGMVFDQDYRAEETNRQELKVSDDSLLVISSINPQADVTVRIPSENLERFLFGVADLGYYTGSSRLKIKDRSLTYLENALKQKARKEAMASLVFLKRDLVARLQTLQLKEEAIGKYIVNKNIDGDAAYSTVNLTLFQNVQIRRETVANYSISEYRLSVGQRIGNALEAGWLAFLNFLLAVLHLWVFILIGTGGFMGYRLWQNRRRLA